MASRGKTLMKEPKRPSSARSLKKPSNAKEKEKKDAEPEKEKEKGFKMPAFSVSIKEDPAAKEKDKKKVMRRNKPAGEDIKKLKDIVKSVKGKKITVQEFIGLIAPSTGDNADLLRFVLAENLNTFRTTARKIYETMTQDISDVLTNEHIQLTESSNEREQLYNDKIVRIMNEIYYLCPDFDFKRYYLEKGYLLSKFPMAPEIKQSSEEEKALLRQEAYHRYQWLKSEGERLKDENTKLQKRMADLKRQQKQELLMAAQREQEAELEREQLENKQEELEEKLDELNQSVEKALVETEDANTEKVLPIKRLKKDTGALPKSRARKGVKPTWAAKAAADVVTKAAADELKIEQSKVSVRSKASSTALKKKKRAKPPPKPQEGSPFHYSPPGTPERQHSEARAKSPFHFSPLKSPERGPPPPKERSPFHYSPIKTPPQASQQPQERSPFHYSPPPASPPRRRVEATTTVVEPQQESRFGRSRAPRDSWGGFR